LAMLRTYAFVLAVPDLKRPALGTPGDGARHARRPSHHGRTN